MIDPKSSNESSLNEFIVERSSIDNLVTSTDESKNIHKHWPVSKFISCSTIYALVMKNLLKLMRNPSVLILMIFLPIISMVTFCLAFRNEAYNIPFVIVNDELPYMLDNCPTYIQGCKHLESPCQAIASLPSISQFFSLSLKWGWITKKYYTTKVYQSAFVSFYSGRISLRNLLLLEKFWQKKLNQEDFFRILQTATYLYIP